MQNDKPKFLETRFCDCGKCQGGLSAEQRTLLTEQASGVVKYLDGAPVVPDENLLERFINHGDVLLAAMSAFPPGGCPQVSNCIGER